MNYFYTKNPNFKLLFFFLGGGGGAGVSEFNLL